MTEYEVREVRSFPFSVSSWKKFAVLGYEQNFTDPEPVLVQCRYFETREEAENYKVYLESQERR